MKGQNTMKSTYLEIIHRLKKNSCFRYIWVQIYKELIEREKKIIRALAQSGSFVEQLKTNSYAINIRLWWTCNGQNWNHRKPTAVRALVCFDTSLERKQSFVKKKICICLADPRAQESNTLHKHENTFITCIKWRIPQFKKIELGSIIFHL